MLNERLKKSRMRAGFTQVELARKVGITKDLYNKYEKTDTRPSYETICKLSQALEVTVDYLLGNTSKPDRLIVDELKEQGFEWVSVVKECRASGLSPEHIKDFIDAVNRKKTR